MRFVGKLRSGSGVLGRVAGMRPIAVDFGTTALKVLQLGAGDPPTLVAAASVPTPEQFLYNPAKRLTYQLEQLPEVIRRGGFKGRRVACVIPSANTFCKHMQVSLGEGVSAQAIVESAIPSELGCPADALIMRHHVVGSLGKGNRSEIICLATPRELIRKMMDALRSARLEAVGMHPELLSLLRGFQGLHVAEADPTLYIDLGWSATRIVIAHGSDLVFARSIEMGGRQLDEVVQQRLNCDWRGANEHRRAMESLVMDDVPEVASSGMAALDAAMRSGGAAVATRRAAARDEVIDLSEPLETLTDEISMSVRYHTSASPERGIARAVFVGGEARHRALCEHIARTLRLPGHAADPMARIARTGKEPLEGVSFASSQPGWAAALGACLSPTDL